MSLRTKNILLVSAVALALMVPYFNCANGPGTNGLFSNDSSTCTDPANPNTCNGDLSKLNVSGPANPVSAASGSFNFVANCDDGNFPKGIVEARVVTSIGGQPISPADVGYYDCANGVFTVTGTVPPAYVWNTLTLKVELKLLVYGSTQTNVPPVNYNAPKIAYVYLSK